MAALPRTEHTELRDNVTEQLFSDNRRFQRGASYLFFEKDAPAQKLIHRLKYGGQAELGEFLGREAAYEYMEADFFEGIDLILPVPLHPRRLRKRGYNQAEFIASGIAGATGIPLDTLEHIHRHTDTPHQARLEKKNREANVANAFAINHPEELYRKHILIVDDVVTTGATIRAVMSALTPARGCKISVFTLGKAV